MRNALPELSDEEGEDEDDGWEGFSEDEEGAVAAKRKQRRRRKDGEGKMEMRSLKHRPGAMKRKSRLEKGEMERFGRNLAQMAGSAGGGIVQGGATGQAGTIGDTGHGAGVSQKERWAALRSFIAQHSG